jgi:hypothetical protein
MAKHEAVAFDKNGKALYLGDAIVTPSGEVVTVTGFQPSTTCGCVAKASQVRKATKKEIVAASGDQARAADTDTVIWGN